MSPIILEAHDLTKKYRHTVALDHIDLQIEKGKIYGFIGQNGAGKTTFLRLVTGLAFPTSGTLGLWGKISAKDFSDGSIMPKKTIAETGNIERNTDLRITVGKFQVAAF